MDAEILLYDNASSKEAKDDLKFKKSLIAQVQRHHILYDTKHKNFSNVAEKEKTWLKIANALTTEVNVCKNTWIDLRYDYQRYARRLRKFFNSEQKNSKRRPVMAMETEMIFLWRFISNKSLYPLPADIESNEDNEKATNVKTSDTVQGTEATEDEDVVILENDPVVVIDLDGDGCSNTQEDNIFLPNSKLLITRSVINRRLVELIKVYPELYNSRHRYYNDFKRKGGIWNAISNEMRDKGTKLMKCWLHMQTRYEWEMNSVKYSNNTGETELQKLLEFLRPHMHTNPNTVYKHAFYLKKNWQEPIENFKNIFGLLAVMKKMPQIVNLTDELLNVETKNVQYFQLWHDIAKIRGTTMGICETTWLILRSFYWELMSMRKHSYQLQDKWYFESIITELYRLADAAKSKSVPSKDPILETPIVVNLDEDKIMSSKIETKQNQSINSSTSKNLNVRVNKPVKELKILSAKSLAPSQVNKITSYTRTGLQITPITQPIAAAAPAAFNRAQVLSLPLNSSPSSSLIALNKNIVPIRLAYQLPAHTKITAFTSSTTAAVSTAITLNAATPNAAIVAATATQTPVAPAPAPTSSPIYKPILPKITDAFSILNPNEIVIKFVASPSGNQLVVHGPMFTEKHSISVDITAKFIREVMAIPVLHNKLINEQPEAINYWHYLSTRFNFPVCICKALWNFLSKNFDKLPQIAPMDDLMKPFRIGITVWRESNKLFQSFQEMAFQAGFRAYRQQLPELMQHIGIQFTDQKEQKLSIDYYESRMRWPMIRAKFPTIEKYKMLVMWMAFKKVYLEYMSELEHGIDNKWPEEWWHVLANMQFLMELRYHKNEPFYYIVRNKIIEEIERYKLQAMKFNTKSLLKTNMPQEIANNSVDVNGQNSLLLSSNPSAKAVQIQSSDKNATKYKTKTYIAKTQAQRACEYRARIKEASGIEKIRKIAKTPAERTREYRARQKFLKLKETNEIAKPAKTAKTSTERSRECRARRNVSDSCPNEEASRRRARRAATGTEFVVADAPKLLKCADIDALTLILAIRRHPQIYQRCFSIEKVKAWKNVALELGTSVSSCWLAFQSAVRKYCTYVVRDPDNKCHLNQKYFKYFKEIFRDVKSTNILNIKTPTELNQTVDKDLAESNEIVFPERFIVDINVDSAKPSLVMKNWAFAIGNISRNPDQVFEDKLRQLFNKYQTRGNV